MNVKNIYFIYLICENINRLSMYIIIFQKIVRYRVSLFQPFFCISKYLKLKSISKTIWDKSVTWILLENTE